MVDETNLSKFLQRELPKEGRRHSNAILKALNGASRRYERYVATRQQWNEYRWRRNALTKITNDAWNLALGLRGLDTISLDDLEVGLGREKIEAIVGHLLGLTRQTKTIVDGIQKTGRPKNLAEERWILEVADIYETNFGRRPTISGAGGGAHSTRGKFYRFLELSMPESFPRHGTLHPRQLMRILRRRRRS